MLVQTGRNPRSKCPSPPDRGLCEESDAYLVHEIGGALLVVARVVQSTDEATLQGFVEEQANPIAQIYTDEAAAYRGMSNPHESVNHSVSKYVR